MTKWLLVAGLGVVVVAFLVSPWPSVLIIRLIFNHGAAEASANLESRVPDSVSMETFQYDSEDGDAFLDIHRPSGLSSGAPTIVWIHGGGFVSGRREDIRNYAAILAGQGFAVVNVDYTIAPEAFYPAPLRQVNAALTYLAQNADQLGINEGRLVLAGDSAGAQIAAQTAAIIVDSDHGERLGVITQIRPESVAGLLLYCGVYDVSGMGEGGGILGWFVKTATWAYTGERDWRQAEGFEWFSIASDVPEGFPPVFVSAGNADPLGPQSVALAEALEANGVDVERLFFPADYTPELGHEYQFKLDTEAGQLALTKSVEWLNER